MKIKLVVGNDNGNNEHKKVIDGKLIQEPNVNCRISKLPWGYDNKNINLESAISDLNKNIVVNINSDAVDNKGLYLVGESALKEEYISNMIVGVDKKHESELPIINTLSQIAIFGIQKVFEETKELLDDMEIGVDMATALPVTQYTEENAAKFRSKFMNHKHIITVYIQGYRVDINIKFEYVKVIPEGVPAVFALEDIPDLKEYKDKKILHCDIGDGTTEYPITDGLTFLRDYIHGTNNGVGHAIDRAIPEFEKRSNIPDVSRQHFSSYLKNTGKYKDRAHECLNEQLYKQSAKIYENVSRQLDKARNDVDILMVYGGGSILMKQTLNDKLEKISNEREIELVYCKPENAVTLNAIGLYKFACSDIFKGLKQKATKGV
jgi:plasmid segregation protein ParM